MFLKVMLLTLVIFTTTELASLQAQYDSHAHHGSHGHAHHGNYFQPSTMYGIYSNYGPHGFYGQRTSCSQLEGHWNANSFGCGYGPSSHFQGSQLATGQHVPPPMADISSNACNHCQQSLFSDGGNQHYQNILTPLPRNTIGGGLSPHPSTFAAVPPSQIPNSMPLSDSHAGHNHGNDDHGDHDHAGHSHANHNHANQQSGNVAQANPQIAGSPMTKSLERGQAQVLQNDSPLMSGKDQLGTIDRGQILKVLEVRGNWVQLETTWLNSNAWIRKDMIQMSEVNPQANEDVAPLAN